MANNDVVILSADNFDEQVLQAKETVLVDFWADWCNPCRMQGPVIDQVAAEAADLKVCKLDIVQNRELAIQHNVQSIPALVFYKNGAEAGRLVGLTPKENILAAAARI